MKKTKIVATISDIKCDVPFLQSLADAGIDVVRLNTAHMSHDGALRVIRNVKAVSDTIAILLDTKGPEVRTGDVEAPLTLRIGDTLRVQFGTHYAPTPDILRVSYQHFVEECPVGASILLDDATIELVVEEKTATELRCVVRNGGVLKSRKNVHVPGVKMNLDGLTAKDEEFIRFAMEHDVDFIAHSFVRNKEDVLAIQKMLDGQGSTIKIIAKIENREGVDNLGEILDHAYGVMVARGDLAVEIPAEEVPLVQKRIIKECIARAKPVITATQMLHTMIEHPRPTRAEVSDVANAILDGTDAVMLSGETASGAYPLEAVQIMVRIAQTVEAAREPLSALPVFATRNKISSYLAKCAVMASQELPTTALVVGTTSGHTARVVAAYRGRNIVHALCYRPFVARQLMLSYGVIPGMMQEVGAVDDLIIGSLTALLERKQLSLQDRIVFLAGAPAKDASSTMLEINTVEQILEEYR